MGVASTSDQAAVLNPPHDQSIHFDSVPNPNSSVAEVIGQECAVPKTIFALPSPAIFRMAWGETYMSSHVENIEAETFEALFEKICEKPSVTDGKGPYVCAPMHNGIRNAANAQPTRVVFLDYDELSPSQADLLRDAVKGMGVRSAIWSTRSSTPTEPRRRVMVALSAPVHPTEYSLVHQALASEINVNAGEKISVDPSSARAEQPQLVPQANSELFKFFGLERIPFDVIAALQFTKSVPLVTAAHGSISTQADHDWLSDPLVAAAKAKGLSPNYVKPGTIGITCPWTSEHTSAPNNSATAILLPFHEGRKGYGFKCMHAHCADRSLIELRKFVGLPPLSNKPSSLSLAPIPKEWLHVPLPPQEFLLDGWMLRGIVALLVAEGGTGKTLLSMRLAMDVAGGRNFLGLPTRHGKAVLLAMEDPEDVLRRRVKRIYDAELTDIQLEKAAGNLFGTSADTYGKNLKERLFCRSLIGSELHLVQNGSGGAVQGEQLEKLIEMLKSIGNVELLVLDPLSRLHGLEENDSSVGTALINAAERIAQEVGCTVLITHHTGKAASRERMTDAYSARGSSALSDAARTVIRLVAAKDESAANYSNISADDIEKQMVLNLVHSKCNYGPKSEMLWLRKSDSGITRFVPSSTDEFQVMWLKFIVWWEKHMAPKAVFKSGLTDRRDEIWGKGISKARVASFIQRAIDQDMMKMEGSSGAKNPASQALIPIVVAAYNGIPSISAQ